MNMNQGSYYKRIVKRGVVLFTVCTLIVPYVPMTVRAEGSADVASSAQVTSSTKTANSTEVGGGQTDELGNPIVTDTDTESVTDSKDTTVSDNQVTKDNAIESEDAVANTTEESGNVEESSVSNETSAEENSDVGLDNNGETTSETGSEALTGNENVFKEVNSETATPVKLDSAFPDEIFRKYVADKYDKDKNGELSETEINSADSIDITYSNIKSVKGIEFLSELIYLNVGNNNIDKINITNNKKLKVLDCPSNNLTSLDVSKNTELTYINIVNNNISNINVANNIKVDQLYCKQNQLSTLDVSSLTELCYLDCGYNDLTELNISKNLKLEQLNINGTKITQINLRSNSLLNTFYCAYTDMTSLDLRNNNLMGDLVCAYSKVASIQWGNMSNYWGINLTDCMVRKVDVSQCPELSLLDCENLNLTELDVTKCPKLNRLCCSNNNLTELDVSNNTLLNKLQCSQNKIRKLVLPNQKKLYDLYCDSNNLVALDASNTDVVRGDYRYNKRELSADKDGYVDLSVLEADGFDIAKASNWSSNVVVDNATKKIKVDFSASTNKPKQVEVTYHYAVNNTYLGDQKFILNITQYRTNIADAQIEMYDPDIYWGLGVNGIKKITYNGNELVHGRDYIVESEGNNINVGTATVTIKGVNDFTGSVTKSFQIIPAPVKNAELINIGNQTYNGTAITPDVSLKLKNLPDYMIKDKDYTLSYTNNTSVGTATVTITGKGNYTGEVTTNFKINPSDIVAGRIEDISDQAYTGSEVKPGVTVTANNTTLVNGMDYDLSYSNNINLGTATVTATGKGNYTGSISKTFKIAIATVGNLRNSKSTTSSIKLKWDSSSGVDGYEIYSCKTGSKKFTKLTTIKKASTTTYTNKKLNIGTAYSYKIRAYKTVNGQKQYGEYTVLNTTTSMSKPEVKLSAGSKKATITYQKVSGADGYEIYMSTSKKGTYENVKTLTKASKIKYTKTGLKKKKTYYFKVRAYKNVNGEKVYSSYSTVKKIKVK